MNNIAERFKYLRRQSRLSQSEFADLIHLSQGRLSDIERGKNKPSADTLLAVSEYFNVSTDWLLQGTGKPPAGLEPLRYEHPAHEEADPIISDSEWGLLREYRRLDDKGRKQIRVFLEFLLYTQKKNKESGLQGVPEFEL